MANDIIYGDPDSTTQPNKFKLLRTLIENEFRNIPSSINNSGLKKFLNPSYSSNPNTDTTIAFTHGDKTINLLVKPITNYNTIQKNDIIPDYDTAIKIVNDLATKKQTSSDHGCSLICTGLCYGACFGGCNGCSSCTGSRG